MKFTRCIFWPASRAITPRRLAAARAWLDREAASLPLSADQVRATQPTPEQRIRAHDESFVAWVKDCRNFTARQWREARRILRAMPDADRAAALAGWNAGPFPKEACYCLVFLRRVAGTPTPHPPARTAVYRSPAGSPDSFLPSPCPLPGSIALDLPHFIRSPASMVSVSSSSRSLRGQTCLGHSRFSEADARSHWLDVRQDGLARLADLRIRAHTLGEPVRQAPLLPNGLGEAIMEHCGLKPGPRIGELKARREQAVLDGALPQNGEAVPYLDFLSTQQ